MAPVISKNTVLQCRDVPSKKNQAPSYLTVTLAPLPEGELHRPASWKDVTIAVSGPVVDRTTKTIDAFTDTAAADERVIAFSATERFAPTFTVTKDTTSNGVFLTEGTNNVGEPPRAWYFGSCDKKP